MASAERQAVDLRMRNRSHRSFQSNAKLIRSRPKGIRDEADGRDKTVYNINALYGALQFNNHLLLNQGERRARQRAAGSAAPSASGIKIDFDTVAVVQ